MPSALLSSIRRRAGLAATHELADDGFARYELNRELRSGSIVRVRQGWYAARTIDPTVLRAARVGGLLTCASLLDLLGIWVEPDRHLHVAVDPHSCRLRSPSDSRRRLRSSEATVVHWRHHLGGSRLVADPLSALEDACQCLTAEMVTASLDSLLRKYPSSRRRLEARMPFIPLVHHAALLRADGVCESGTETLFWLRMRHPSPRRQIQIAGVGRVDFLFGTRLVIEIDGAEFHADVDHFEADRRRDALLSTLGFRVLRFSYRQVMFDWPAVERAVRAALERGDHY